MWDLCRLIWWVLVDLFRPRTKLEAEILMLRQQINVLRRTASKKLLRSSIDRLIFVGLYRLFPDVRGALMIVKPDTVIRWHRAGHVMTKKNVGHSAAKLVIADRTFQQALPCVCRQLS